MSNKYKYIILKADTSAGDPGMNLIEEFLEDGWEPFRETPMPSSCGGPVMMGPRVLCILIKRESPNHGEKDTPPFRDDGG